MTGPNPRDLLNRLTELLDLVDEALTEACRPVALKTIETGEVGGQFCCDGHLYIRVVRAHVVNPFPNQTLEPRNCTLPLGALVEIGVLRCAPTLSSDGDVPSAEEITASNVAVYEDAAIIYQVLKDYNPDWAQDPIVLDTFEPLQSQGGCAGGFWQFWLDIAMCPPECPPTAPTGPSEETSA